MPYRMLCIRSLCSRNSDVAWSLWGGMPRWLIWAVIWGNSHTAATAVQILHQAIGRGTSSLFTMEHRPTRCDAGTDTHTQPHTQSNARTVNTADCELWEHLSIYRLTVLVKSEQRQRCKVRVITVFLNQEPRCARITNNFDLSSSFLFLWRT